MRQQIRYLIGTLFSVIKKIILDNLLIMWYSSAILNQEVNFMKYVGSKARLSNQLAPIIQSYIDGMGDKCNGYGGKG